MKRLLALLLALTMLFSVAAVFAGCEDSGKKKNTSSRNDDDDEDEEEEEEEEENDSTGTEDSGEEPTEPEETQPESLIFSGDTEIMIEDTISFTVVNFYATGKVMPPKPTSVYSYYTASENSVYLVVVMDVKHLGTESIAANKLIVPTASVDGSDYTPFVLVEEEDGGDLARGSSTTVAPLQTVRLYFLYSVPDTADTEDVTLSASVDGIPCTGSFTREEFESRITFLSVGDEITDGNTLSATLDSVEFTDALYPPNPTGYYHYYPAGDGNVYLVVKLTVKNLKGTDMGYDTIAGISCVYKGKYNYSFSTVLETDDGQDLSGYPSQYAIAPLDDGIVYYLAEVPEEVQDGPVEITLYLAGKYYRYEI